MTEAQMMWAVIGTQIGVIAAIAYVLHDRTTLLINHLFTLTQECNKIANDVKDLQTRIGNIERRMP